MAALVALYPLAATSGATAVALSPTGLSPSAQVSATANSASFVPLRRGNLPASGFDTEFKNVDYNGGPIMPSNTDYLVFWSPSGLGAYGSGTSPEYVSGLETYFKDLAHDSGGSANTDSVATQYGDASGATVHYQVTFGGTLVDTDPYPTSQCPVAAPVKNCLTDAQIQTELEAVVAKSGLPHDLTHEYFLMTPPHVEGCFSNNAAGNPAYGGCSAGIIPGSLSSYCAYHSNTTISPMLFYAVDPYVTGNRGCDDGNHPNGPSDGALDGGLSHEHNESITDPIPNDAWTNGVGAKHGDEIADQCDGVNGAALGTAPNGAKYNQVINGHYYWYQEEWSNKTHSCLQRLALTGSLPHASFKPTSTSGLSVTLDASASSATGGIADYVWQFNDAFGAVTVEQTTPTITHTFPAAGAYSVGLTVLTSNGTSAGAGEIVSTGSTQPTPGFTYSPAAPTAGASVSFTGLSTVSAKAVRSYLWEFGDGTTGSGQAPTHTYSKPGVYTVTAVLFSGVGSAYPGAGAAPIFTEQITVK